MNEALFRIGGTYRNKRGRVVTLVPHQQPEDEFVVLSMSAGGNWYGEALHRLSDGANDSGFPEYDLIPGELHQVAGQWVAKEDKPAAQPMAPYFAEALEDKPAKIETLGDLLREALRRGIGQPKPDHDPNAAMIARDGVAPKATTVALPAAPPNAAATPPNAPPNAAHKAVAGLTFLANVDHRLGLGR